MSGDWYQAQNGRRAYPSPSTPSRNAVDAVQDAHSLMAHYPFASATPATHVARHLSGLSLTATPPSYYIQPAHYSQYISPYASTIPSQVHDYAQEISHLASANSSYADGGYWENERNNAIRYVGEQASSYGYAPQWSTGYSDASTYETSAFAQSIFQHTTPSTAYPTPPPGISSSSSSLAMALKEPTPKKPAVKKVYKAEDSAEFFDNFLAQQSAELKKAAKGDSSTYSQALEKTPRKPKPPRESSPDSFGATPSTPSRKRKAASALESPSVKRSIENGNGVFLPKSSSDVRHTLHTTNGAPAPRTKLEPYIMLPPVPRPYATPSSKSKGKMRADSEDEQSGIGDESDGSPLKWRQDITDSVHSSGRRAIGDRDDRGPLDKLTSTLEDIFEAEDSLPPDLDIADIPTEFFSLLTIDTSAPFLHAALMRKLTSQILKVARPTKRLRQNTRDSTHKPSSKTRNTLAELETATLSRILRMLERTVKAGEDLDPFDTAHTVPSTLLKSPTKKKAKGTAKSDERPKSSTPRPEGDDPADGTLPAEPSTAEFTALHRSLELAKESVYAADCCLTLLGSERLTKQLYSEELITACLSSVKNQLSKIIYPFVEASSDSTANCPPLLRYLLHSHPTQVGQERQLISEVFHAISSAIPRITQLVCAESMPMSESIIIQAVYIAIGPFFVVESATDSKGREKKDSAVFGVLGSSAMRGLRLEALSLIRSIFANHEDQRSWIIEEILSSLIKLSDSKQKAGQFRLRDGRSIRTVSALLLQLVQTSAHDVRVEAEALRDARQQALALRRQEGVNDAKTAFLDEKDMEELRLYTSGLDSATKAAKTIIAFLTQRSGRTKSTKNSNEAEYRSIFDNLIADLLTVLFWPEWPAAAVLLGVASKFMISSLDDVKTSSQNENNAAKTMALDHLGVIAARLRSCIVRKKNQDASRTGLKSIDEISSELDCKALEALVTAHQDVSAFLLQRSSEDQAYGSARELTAVIIGQELAISLKQCATQLEDPDDGAEAPKPKVLQYGSRLKDALRELWQDHSVDVFNVGVPPEELSRVDRLSETIGITQSLRNYFSPILNVILQALDAPPVFMRTKALKALGQILTSDPAILSADNVRRAIESHLLDSSPAVRDAAVELIGKYIIDFPQLAGNYYTKIADRIADTGLGVRKRVIKLMKSVYGVMDDRSRQVDICTRMVLRMGDEDDTVKDLACKTIEELWFHDATPITVTRTHERASSSSGQDRTQLLRKVAIIMGVSANFKDRNSPLEELLHKMMADKPEAETSQLHRKYAEICETLIDGLVDANDLPGFTVINCVRTIYLFASAYPAVLSSSNATTLLPYLKNASTPEDQIISDYLLRIFRACIPHLPTTAKAFGQELQTALQPMILKPSTAAGVAGLQESVACLCVVVHHLTHEFKRLVMLLKSCSARLMSFVRSPSDRINHQDTRALPILILIVALLCEHCNFDQLRVENPSVSGAAQTEIRTELDSMTTGAINEYMYTVFLQLYDKFRDGPVRSRVLQCLGFLFRAQPALLTAEQSSRIMDDIFASSDVDARARLLKIMQDFLVSEADKHAAREKEKAAARVPGAKESVNMEELVGNTDGFAESGVSSVVIQRYLNQILEAALSQTIQIQSPAVDILTFTIKQGLAHPLQCFPVIVALETSSNFVLSSRANNLHSILHNKHTSLLNARYVASARASFDYQKRSAKGPVRGYRMCPAPTALLHRWYTLVRDKRATRQEFIRALVKVFDVELNNTSHDDVEFARYMAENFAAFDYKTHEEILTVLKLLTAVLSTSGMQLVETFSPEHLLKQLHESTQPQQPIEAPPEQLSQEEFAKRLPLARSSVIIVIIMLLKSHLKALYGISEEKCSKWVIGKKTPVGDRPASRRNEKPLVWERVPYAITPILTTQDLYAQRDRFLEIWSEDGVAAEPEDDPFT